MVDTFTVERNVAQHRPPAAARHQPASRRRLRARLAGAASVVGVLLRLWLGVALALSGFGLLASFGLLSPLGIPILAVGLAVITAQLD